MSRAAKKGQRSSASTWRKRDRAYREQERARRAANRQRREVVAEAAARGVTPEQVRAERAD
ncbi:MAG: hypothetical protein ACOYOQ_00475 [Microthrixaceae bacterium]